MIILFVCVCVCVCLRFTEHLFSWLLIPSTKPHLMLNLFICSEELARGGDTLCSAPFYLFFGCFFFFDLFSWSIEVFYFAQIIHKFCEGGGGHTGLLTFLCVTQFVFEWGVVMMLVGERKPNAPPLSVDSVNIKFDSLAPTYLLALFINSHC